MEEFNPVIVVLLFMLRCLVPLLLMLALTYVLHRIGLIKDAPPAPPDWNGNGSDDLSERRGNAHGKI